LRMEGKEEQGIREDREIKNKREKEGIYKK
jgi:hypothetical protein